MGWFEIAVVAGCGIGGRVVSARSRMRGAAARKAIEAVAGDARPSAL